MIYSEINSLWSRGGMSTVHSLEKSGESTVHGLEGFTVYVPEERVGNQFIVQRQVNSSWSGMGQ